MPDEEGVFEGVDEGVAVEGADVDGVEEVAVAAVPVSFFAEAPESAASPDGGFILLE